MMFIKPGYIKPVIILLISLIPVGMNAQISWALKKDKEDIKVYTGTTPNSSFKSVRVTTTLPGTLSQLAALLLDVDAHKDWVYSTKHSYLVKQVSPREQIYYSEIDLPWPLANREIVVLMNINQDPISKVMIVRIENADNRIAVKSGTVRVPASSVTWRVTPLDNDSLSIEYFGQADPGGSVPAWAANSFCTKGPFETFKSLRKLISSPEYANASFDFIRE